MPDTQAAARGFQPQRHIRLRNDPADHAGQQHVALCGRSGETGSRASNVVSVTPQSGVSGGQPTRERIMGVGIASIRPWTLGDRGAVGANWSSTAAVLAAVQPSSAYPVSQMASSTTVIMASMSDGSVARRHVEFREDRWGSDHQQGLPATV